MVALLKLMLLAFRRIISDSTSGLACGIFDLCSNAQAEKADEVGKLTWSLAAMASPAQAKHIIQHSAMSKLADG